MGEPITGARGTKFTAGEGSLKRGVKGAIRMPEKITKLANGKYQVRGPHGIHAKGTSKVSAEAQRRLLNAIDHGWKPTHKH